jgi:hypothetical protein
MTNFADRLIARGTGRPAGLPLLKARPAARFEQEMIPQLEAGTPEAQRVEKSTRPPAAPRKINPTPAKDARQTHSAEPALPDEGVKIDGIHAPASDPLAPPAPPSLRAAPASRRVSEMLAQSEAPESESPIADPPAIERPEVPRDQRPMFFDVPPIVHKATAAPTIESTPAPPNISIGRIDVQFLPQERPTAPARPQPQRTRGFDTYARARRGEPR